MLTRVFRYIDINSFEGADASATMEKTLKIVTSLSFRDECRAAFEFYTKSSAAGLLPPMPYGDAPPGMPITDEKYKTWTMHCWLEIDDQA